MWQRFKDGFRRFMQGRYGADQLSRVLMYAGIAMLVVGMFSNSAIFSIIAWAIYAWTIFRMFSKNVEKRALENQKYLNLTANFRTGWKQARARSKNGKEYKYFRCQKCRSWLKLPRGVGEVTVTCGKCKNQFRKKA